MAMRSPPAALFLAPIGVVVFVVAHSAFVTPPDVISTILHAVLEGAGAAVGYVVGALVGLMVPAQKGRPGPVWIALLVAAVVWAGVMGGLEQALGENAAAVALNTPPGPDQQNPFLWLGLAAWAALPIGVWAAAAAGVFGGSHSDGAG
jgi:hypothetical protein